MAVVMSLPRLRPETVIVLRPGGRVQVGCDPETAVVLEPPVHVSPACLVGLLRWMTGPRSITEVTAAAADIGLDLNEVRGILDRLVAVGIGHHLPHAGAQRPLTIRVHGSGPLATAVARAVGAGGHRVRQSVRRPRLAPDHPDTEKAFATWSADLVVLTDFLTHDPWLIADLMKSRVPHLTVRLRDGSGVIGPLVLPGLTSCLVCADHHRRDRDAEWPIVCAQLFGQRGWASPATIAGTVALTVAQIEHITAVTSASASASSSPDHDPPTTVNATIELRPNASSLQIRQWTPHPLCGCGVPA
ncbi:hypothetical protein [Williamsia sp. D3]|uniref:hypothetical protein n=1 Tax=Williamsia sp. D3 TaxID=1313067 RepID=UPI0003D2BE54|nr:hypothetical protein [Williamsia sp. D3]ETD33852.1 hypothetical protein W823_05750 [Williamsia sp. D3]